MNDANRQIPCRGPARDNCPDPACSARGMCRHEVPTLAEIRAAKPRRVEPPCDVEVK